MAKLGCVSHLHFLCNPMASRAAVDQLQLTQRQLCPSGGLFSKISRSAGTAMSLIIACRMQTLHPSCCTSCGGEVLQVNTLNIASQRWPVQQQQRAMQSRPALTLWLPLSLLRVCAQAFALPVLQIVHETLTGLARSAAVASAAAAHAGTWATWDSANTHICLPCSPLALPHPCTHPQMRMHAHTCTHARMHARMYMSPYPPTFCSYCRPPPPCPGDASGRRCEWSVDDRDAFFSMRDGVRCQCRQERNWGGARATLGAFGGRVYYEVCVVCLDVLLAGGGGAKVGLLQLQANCMPLRTQSVDLLRQTPTLCVCKQVAVVYEQVEKRRGCVVLLLWCRWRCVMRVCVGWAGLHSQPHMTLALTDTASGE